MGLFFKKKQEPERTDDERLKNLEKINRSYTTVGVYGDPLSPTELQQRIRTAYKDMEELIKRERTCRWVNGLCSECSCRMDANDSYCSTCGARVIE